MFWGFDIYYFVLIIPAMLFAMWAQFKVSSTFNRYSTQRTRNGMTGAQAAEAVLRACGVTNVRIERVRGNLTDHFDPRAGVIRLSESVYDSASVAAVGVAAHEAGHAAQYAEGYGPIRLRNAIIPVTQIGSSLAWPLLLIGLLFNYESLFFAGILFFTLSVVFQLVTLPVEFNASARAVSVLGEGGYLSSDEMPGARKTLSAAAMTYVAALAVSIAQLLRLLLIFGGGRRRLFLLTGEAAAIDGGRARNGAAGADRIPPLRCMARFAAEKAVGRAFRRRRRAGGGDYLWNAAKPGADRLYPCAHQQYSAEKSHAAGIGCLAARCISAALS